MKNQDIMSNNDVEKLYEKLFENTSREQVKTNLKSIHDICEKMVGVNASPSVPAVVKALASKGIIVSERSIYNRRAGKNPYPILIDAWVKVAQGKKLGIEAVVKASTASQTDNSITVNSPNALLTEDDLLKISDPVLRYKISILYGQMTSLTKQNAAIRELRGLPAVYPDHITQMSDNKIDAKSKLNVPSQQLNSLDVEILTNLLDGQSGRFYFDTEGTLYAGRPIRTHTALSDPGLKDVLEKLLPKKLIT
ncbi:hypothetical protein L3V31_12675 [Vibrio sp. J1-1]|uniref:hypothetical protein n=1 Tax=Vibrio sp. J1-1 TaxID=2912251 RepID=UPI001F336328|nr:hypothetical protein [Vibrio sp. J1-1]MCF7482582.1 hypothetical protein [Vibrio sp. J1-1]